MLEVHTTLPRTTEIGQVTEIADKTGPQAGSLVSAPSPHLGVECECLLRLHETLAHRGKALEQEGPSHHQPEDGERQLETS